MKKCLCMKHPENEVRVIVCTEAGLVFDGYIKRKDDTMIQIMMMEGKVCVEYSELEAIKDSEKVT